MLSARPAALRVVQRLPVLYAGRAVSNRAFFRIPFKTAPATPKETVTKYRIRLQKPSRFSKRSLFNRVVNVATVFAVAYYLNPFESIKIVKAEGEDEALMTGDGVVRDDQNGEEAADEDEGSGIFLPIWWPVMEEQAFYKDSDPEMQVFFKFEKDHKKKREVILRLARKIYTEVSKDAHLKEHVGEWLPKERQRFILDAVYPHAPPDYLVLGIHFALPYISLAEQRLSQEDYLRLRSVLYPAAAFRSFWAAHKAAYENFARSIGLQAVEPQQGGSNTTQPKGPTATKMQAEGGNQPANRSSAGTAEAASGTQGNGSDKASSAAASQSAKGPVPEPVFVKTYRESIRHRDLHQVNSRGSIIFTGLVEMKCTKGMLLIDVTASYCPHCDHFETVKMHLRAVKPSPQQLKDRE